MKKLLKRIYKEYLCELSRNSREQYLRKKPWGLQTKLLPLSPITVFQE